MFVLRTGLQGNGKTLNTIKEVDQKAHAEGRKVYYCNVTGFNPGHPAIKAEWLPFDTPEKWFELPANAIIVIDEAQTWFRVRPTGSKVPEYASRLEIMRKDGHELHAITQSPRLIDSHMRELCNRHIHYHRGNGGQVIKRWEFQKPEPAVNSNQLTFANGEATRITIDKTYFGCYESVKEGTEHHFKFRLPRAAFALGLAALFIGGVGFYLYNRLTGFADAAEAPQQLAESVQAAPVASEPSQSAYRPTVEQYIADRKPRIEGVPSSAPIYDELTKPVSFPRPSCYATKSEEIINRRRKSLKLGNRDGRLHGCACLSQQGTRLDIPFEACMNMVENGAFDPTRPDQQPSADGDTDALRAAGAPAAAQAGSRAGTSITVIPHEREPRTLL
jgi:hypothetical protein